MEHFPKRRRIERGVARPLADFVSREGVHSPDREIDAENNIPIIGPEPVPPPADPTVIIVVEDDLQDSDPILDSSHELKLQPLRLELRQLIQPQPAPTVNGVAQPVNNVAQPVITTVAPTVQNAVNGAKQPVNNVAQPVVSNIVQPVAPKVANAPPDAINKIPPVPAPTPPNTAPQVSPSPVTPPGVVSPLPAAAASEARAQALATQEAKAAQKDRLLPSSEGPAPPAPAPAVNNAASGHVAMSVQLADTTSQKPLSQPSTPIRPSPEATSSKLTSPSSYFPTSQIMTNLPSPSHAPNAVHSSPSIANNNSTLSATSTSNPSSASLTDSLLSASSQASISSLNSMSQAAFLSSSSMEALTRNNQNPMSTFVTSPTTLMTLTSASKNPSLSSAAASSTTTTSGTGPLGGLSGGTPTSGGNHAASSAAGSGSGSGNGMPPTKVLVGGIVGGIAGGVLILVALLFLLRWRRGNVGQTRNISPPVAQSAGAGSAALGGGGTMTQRSSSVPIAAAGFFGRLRPTSSQTAATTDTAPSERGFQKISGRKLPSVLQSGGDGYGDAPNVSSAETSSAPPARGIAPGQGPFAGLAPGLRPSSPHSLSGSSFYRDSHGFYGGVLPAESFSEPTDQSTSPTSTSPTFPVPPSAVVPLAAAGRPPGNSSPGIPNIRPGPARQPVINQGGIVPMRTPSRAQQPRPRAAPSIAENPPDSPRDPLGRSHPSQDGSRQSRFRESTTPP